MLRNHLVVGPEGSGTTMMSKLLSEHPDAGYVLHCSFPSPRGAAHAYDPAGERMLFAWEDWFGPSCVSKPGPRLGEGWPEMSMMDLNGIDPEGEMVLWVVTRDRSCTELSQLRSRIAGGSRSCERQSAFGRDVELQRLYIEDQLRRRTGLTVFVSYETLIQWGEFYLRARLKEGGLCPDKYEYDKLDLIDQNVKWIRDQ